MKNNSRYKTRVGQLVVAGVISGFGVYANANDFTITSGGTQGQFTLSNGSGFSSSAAVDATGQVGAINSIPLTDSFGIPNFAFTLGNSATPTNKTHTFKVGVSISEVGTNRRLEAYIGTLNLVVNGATVTGDIPTQNLTVLARAGSLNATTTLNNTNANGPYAISGGGISFSGSNLVNGLLPDSLFSNILGEFNTGGNTYDYSIVIEETTGAPKARFGIDTGTFTSFTAATPPTTVFDLNSDQLQANFGAGSYRVNGRFTTAAAGSGAGGGGTPAGQVETATVEATGTAAAAANTAITSGTAEEAQSALNTAATSLETLATSVTNGDTLSAEQQAAVQTNVATIFSNVVTLINKVSGDPVQLSAAVATLNKTLDAMQKAKVPATAAMVNSVVAAGQASARGEAIRQAGLGANATPEEIAAALVASPAALEATLRQSIRIPSNDVLTDAQIAAKAELMRDGQNYTNNIVNANIAAFDASKASVEVNTEHLRDALSFFSFGDDRTGGTFALESNTGVVRKDDSLSKILTFEFPGEAYAAYYIDVRAVPTEVPTGTRILRDGTAVIVNRGYAMRFAPVPIDVLGFSFAVVQAGYTNMTIGVDDAAYRIDFGGGQRFAGVFAYDNLTGKTLDFRCGGTTIVEPTIAPTAPEYSFGVNCANGVQQRMVPYMDNTNFFASLEAAQIPYQVDRSTGIITSEGNGRFKPSFFISPLTAAETAFHDANKDANGVAFQALDVNGDGRIDFKVIAPNGTQVLYGVN
ncbi:hypothetical protein [Pseudohongiella sp.]|uniref:Uncharacterized protein n=1 Tax=marine sediment metagenome TaxID=412755 RepID=A0A0F9YHU2_9ZZZZ|nr:hypothetical protein [Pseudohongiella sp.]HDZ08965.1 hypothetical protein [Pseudohongiella sp.]HEA62650.1 hypothetical protein [Pseudohongiella sp.]